MININNLPDGDNTINLSIHHYRSAYLEQHGGNHLFQLAPANWRELNGRSVIIHGVHQQEGEEAFRLNPAFISSVQALNASCNWESERSVYKLIKIGDKIYVDPYYDFTRTNPFYDKHFYLPKVGVSTKRKVEYQKAVKLLGGIVLSGNWEYTDYIVNPKVPSVRGNDLFNEKIKGMTYTDMMSLKTLQEHVKMIYNR